MEGLKRRLSLRKKKKDVKVPECSKPHQWQEDEKKVREGSCSFQVRYLGCVEVFESRGMQVCEEAVKTLKAQCKGKYQRAILYVSGDALRVVDEISKSMIVDQTIEKVSFCAPDRNHEKGFAYICRDGTTRRWMCHGFLAVKESKLFHLRRTTIKGERLSHAVGCAFAICLERKQKRDKESGASNVTVTFSQDKTSFTRMGSFRQTTLTERITDPQSAIISEPVPVKKVDNLYAVQRPHASQNMLLRQGSFRGFPKLQETTSPFKRTISLRLNELPSTLQRQNAVEFSPTKGGGINNNGVIPELSPETDESISQMCQQLTQGITALSDDPFASAPVSSSHPTGPVKQHSMPATFHTSTALVHHPTPAVHETNPWATASPHFIGSGDTSKHEIFPGRSTPSTNPFLTTATSSTSTVTNGTVTSGSAVNPAVSSVAFQHMRSHSIDTSDMSDWHVEPSKKQTLLAMSQHQSFQQGGASPVAGSKWANDTDWSAKTTQQTSTQNQSINTNVMNNTTGTVDPFDVAWMAKHSNKQDSANNQFSTKTTYKVEL